MIVHRAVGAGGPVDAVARGVTTSLRAAFRHERVPEESAGATNGERRGRSVVMRAIMP